MAKSVRKTEDMLPKVLVAGQPSDCVPRIIICDGMQKKERRPSRESQDMHGHYAKSFPSASAPASCPPNFSCPPVPSPPSSASPNCCQPESQCPPPIKPSSRRRSERNSLPSAASRQLSYQDDSNACSKLMMRMQSLKEEMCALARQNEKMQQTLRSGNNIQKCRVNQSDPCARPVTYPKDVEGRFREYSKHTSVLEKQVATMEHSVRCLNEQFMEAAKKQKEMEKARMHAQKLTETLECQKLERQPKLKCRDNCKGNCAKQTEKCTCSKPDYQCG